MTADQTYGIPARSFDKQAFLDAPLPDVPPGDYNAAYDRMDRVAGDWTAGDRRDVLMMLDLMASPPAAKRVKRGGRRVVVR